MSTNRTKKKNGYQSKIELYVVVYIEKEQIVFYTDNYCWNYDTMEGDKNMTNKEKIINNIKTNKKFKLFIRMYGGYNDEIIEKIMTPDINCCLSSGRDDGFYYIWGWPGPDMNFYLYNDYGKTWAFIIEDFV